MRGRYLLLAILGGVYLGWSAAHDLQPFDSSEFVLNCAQFGLGHPPGQPGYTLFGGIFLRLLPLAPAFSLSLLSALATIVTALLVLKLGARLGARPSWLGVILVAALWLVPGVWDLATRPEVYAPATLLGLAALALVLGRGAALAWPLAWAAGGLLGLSATMNPVLAFYFGLAILLALLGYISPRGWRKTMFIMGILAVGALVGLLPYAYLPWAGARAARILVWGAPLRGSALSHFLLGRDYRGWQLGGAEYAGNLAAALEWLIEQNIAPWAIGGAAGFLLAPLPRFIRILPILLTFLGVATIAANHPFVPANPDYVGYFLPSLWLDGLGVLLLLPALGKRCSASLSLPWRQAARGLLLIVLATSATVRVQSTWKAHGHVTRHLASLILNAVPEHGVVVLESDYLVFPALVLQELEGVRPDVIVLNIGWASSSWYWRHLAARHAELTPIPPKPLDIPGMPQREARVAALLATLGRPVVAESLRLASLAGGKPCGQGWLSAGRCQEEKTASSPSDNRDNGFIAQLARLAAEAKAGSLDEQLLAKFSLQRAHDALLEGKLELAPRIIRAGMITANPF